MWRKLAVLAGVLPLCLGGAPTNSAGLDFRSGGEIERQWSGATPRRATMLSPAPAPTPRGPRHLYRVQTPGPAPADADAPPPPEDAVKAEMEKRYDEAERIYREALRREPDRVDLLLRLADVLGSQGKREQAAETMATAADRRPGDGLLQLRASEAFGAADKLSEAVRYNDRALALRPNDPAVQRRRADLLVWAGNYRQAEAVLRALLQASPNDLTLKRDLGRVLGWRGEYDDAAELLSEYLTRFPRDTDTLLDYARVQAARGDAEAATELLRRFRAAGGDDAKYRAELAEMTSHPVAAQRAEAEKRYGDAERVYRELLAKEPNRTDLLQRLADVLATQNKKLEAAQTLAKIADLQPGDADVQLRASQAFGAADRRVEAMRYNERALALRPGDRALQRRRAELAIWNGKYGDAEKTLRQLIEAEPGDPTLKRDLGRVLGFQKRSAEAEKLLSEYLAQRPDDKDALLDLARIGADRGNRKAAAEALERYRAAGGDEATYRRERTRMLAPKPPAKAAAAGPAGAGAAPSVPPAVIAAEQGKRYDEAVRLIRALIAKEPRRVELWLRLVDNLAVQKKSAEAAEAMARAADLRPDDAGLQLRASEAFGAADKPAEALRYVNRALALKPGDLALHRRRASLATWAGDNAQAEESLRILIAADPNDWPRRLDLGRVVGWQSRLEEAVILLREYVAQRPNDPEGLIALARVEAGRGNSAEAIALLERYRSAGGDDLTYRRELALFLAWAGRPYGALAVAEPGLAADPEGFQFHFARAVAWQQGYQYAAAIGEVERLTQLRPTSPEIVGLRRSIEVLQRPYLQLDGGARWESDHITAQTAELSYHQPIDDVWWVFGGGGADFVQGLSGTAFSSVHGGSIFNRGYGFLGAQARLGFATLGSARIGATSVGGGTAPTWQASYDTRLSDELRLQAVNMRDAQIVSPRALSRGISRIDTQLQATYTPDLSWTVVALGREAELSDRNQFFNAIIAPRRAILRTQYWNLDLGVSGNWQHYALRVPLNGYYSPAFYQLYQTTAYLYWKISDEDGVSLLASVGENRDEKFHGFKLAYDFSFEATFGALSDWMVKLRGAYTNHGSASGPGFSAESVGFTVVRRF
jgi:predicted Zn-dependent protease